MKQKPLRVYADTSVFGGAFDAEFQTGSQAFFSQVQDGHFILVLSPLVRDELEEAPGKVRELYQATTYMPAQTCYAINHHERCA